MSVLESSWLNFLSSLVAIESGPSMVDGIERVQQLAADRLVDLSFEVDTIPNAGPDVLVARRGSANAGAARILILAHADTVFPEGTIDEWPFATSGDRATGPGVADMKGGLVTALRSLDLVGSRGRDLTVTVLVNGDEESGSVHSRRIIEDESREHDLVLVFEPSRPSGQFVIGRRGVQRFEVRVQGRAAHTGVEPDKGANAIEAASLHAIRLQQLGRDIDGASVTVARIGGGSRPNIVPDSAWLLVDTRLADAAALERVEEEVTRLQTDEADVPGTSTTVHYLDGRPPMVPSDRTLELASEYVAAALQAGTQTAPTFTGGSSDGNFTAACGIPTLDGLGPVGGGYHTTDEFVVVDSIERRARACAGFLTNFVAGHGS